MISQGKGAPAAPSADGLPGGPLQKGQGKGGPLAPDPANGTPTGPPQKGRGKVGQYVYWITMEAIELLASFPPPFLKHKTLVFFFKNSFLKGQQMCKVNPL